MKKKLLSTLFIIYQFSCFAQSGISWNMSMDLAPSSSGNSHPRIVTDANGNPLVVWHHVNRAMFSRWNGTAFTTPLMLNPASIDVAGASWMGPDIAAHGDTVYVVFKQSPENLDSSHIFCTRSFDGGQTFNTPVRVDYIADSLSRFPTITTDDLGNPVIGFMKFNAAFLESRWVVTSSADFGSTFSQDKKASGWSSPTSVICDCCPGAVVNSGNSLAMLYRDNNSDLRDIWVGLSTNNGDAFSSGMDIDQSSWVINACPATGPDGVIIGDTLYSTYMSAASQNSLVYWSAASLSNAAGAQGTELTGNFTGLTQQNYPRIATDGNALAVVWKQRVNSVDQCMLRFSADATSFASSIPDTVDQDKVTNADVALANGNIYIVWEDDAVGTIQFRSGTYNSTAGIISNSTKIKVSIYPNPSSGSLHIRSDKTIDKIYIYNSFGQIVFRSENSGKAIDPVLSEGGVYTVRIIHGNLNETRRVFILE